MSELNSSQQELFGRQLGEAEIALDAYEERTEQGVSDEQIINSALLTDRRLLLLQRDTKKQERSVSSTVLSDVQSTEVHHKVGSSVNRDYLYIGLALLLGGTIVSILGFGVGGELMQLMGVFGFLGVVAGIFFLLEGFRSEEGEVTLQLLNSEQDVIREVATEENGLRFAESVAAHIGTLNEPKKPIERKID